MYGSGADIDFINEHDNQNRIIGSNSKVKIDRFGGFFFAGYGANITESSEKSNAYLDGVVIASNNCHFFTNIENNYREGYWDMVQRGVVIGGVETYFFNDYHLELAANRNCIFQDPTKREYDFTHKPPFNQGVMVAGRGAVFIGRNAGTYIAGDSTNFNGEQDGLFLTGMIEEHEEPAFLFKHDNSERKKVTTSIIGRGISICGLYVKCKSSTEYVTMPGFIQVSSYKSLPTDFKGYLKLTDECTILDKDGREIIKNGVKV